MADENEPADGLSAELRAAFPGVTIDLAPSTGGVFEVDLDGRRIFSKAALDRFPAYQEVPRLVLEAED